MTLKKSNGCPKFRKSPSQSNHVAQTHAKAKRNNLNSVQRWEKSKKMESHLDWKLKMEIAHIKCVGAREKERETIGRGREERGE